MTLEPNQLNLFSDVTLTPARRAEALVMSQDALVRWKAQILDYQQRVRETKPVQQTALFDLAPAHCDPDIIDPFTLHLQPMAFYRMPDDFGQAALYFVIDSVALLLLYVGETCQRNNCRKNTHDCKDYISSYQDLHYRYQMQTAVNIGFSWDAPVERKARQTLEQAMIQKFKSPFNKENWERWGQPFK
jgi:hypothetical protein